MKVKQLGDILREARLYKGVSLKQVAHVLKMKEHLLVMLEEGEWEQLQKKIYLQGCVRHYAKWLGVNGEELYAKYCLLQGKIAAEDDVLFVPSSFAQKVEFNLTSRIKLLAIALSVVVAVIGICWQLIEKEVNVVPLYHPIVYMPKQLDVSTVRKSLRGQGISDLEIDPYSSESFLQKSDVFFTTYKKGTSEEPK